MRVIAVRHAGRESQRTGREGGDWVVSPTADTEIEAGDVLIAKGTRTGASRLAELVA
jgi:uncharacterized protein with PhoU and TrkA domain